ncbi:hypothetical protein C9374_009514 [Naegleria lovaniensis]|uniref:Cation-transporting P-type ATPase N-terminal domain-containing protein n=1 Tax=Naegleria lovaniensis TaxID=51637 RepID=A0AA88H4X3_NAELO|nr:uncharacterized protein C9374_009514 [Naegleria lovaniensis]KAG2392937.1 hypothetical protein C9374_009514 [Naegleria lovaniensis]
MQQLHRRLLSVAARESKPKRSLDIAINKGSYGITIEELDALSSKRDISELEYTYGGVKNIAKSLGTDIDQGINSLQVEERRIYFGKHLSSPRRTNSWFKLFIDCFRQPFVTTFFILAVLSILFGVSLPEDQSQRQKGWIEGVSLLFGCLFVCLANSFNEWQKKRKWNEIYTKQDSEYRVNIIRDGKLCSLLMEDIVVGDVIQLEPGDFITCEGIIIECYNLICDENLFVGQQEMTLKDVKRNPFISSGTFVTNGYGKMLVTNVGLHSKYFEFCFNTINEEEDGNNSALETRLAKIANNIWKISLGFSIGTFVVLFGGWMIFKIVSSSTNTSSWDQTDLITFLKIFCLCFSVLFVCTPEGIYKIITTSLAYSTRRTIKDNILCSFHQTPDVCERLSYTSQVIVDKSVLTQKNMNVVKVTIAGETIEMNGENQIDETLLQILSSAIAVDSRATLKYSEHLENYEGIGDPLDCSLLLFLQQVGVDYAPIRNYYHKEHKVVKMFPVENGTMTTIVNNGKSHIIFTKGDYERIIQASSGELLKEGIVSPLDATKKSELVDKMHRYSSEGYYVIALAYREIEADCSDWTFLSSEYEEDFVIIALMILIDPIKPGVHESIAELHKAGITVKLVTSDNTHIARKIATECGILSNTQDNEGLIMEGPSLRHLIEEDVEKISKNLRVLSKANPYDKLRLITCLQRRDEFVTLFASSYKDLTAVQCANVGAVQGISGSHSTKNNSDLLITDDNLSSLVRAIAWGRALFYNIQKYLVFHMTINIVVMIFTAATALTSYLLTPTQLPPFNPVQLFWVHIIMDIFAALSLASDPPPSEIMTHLPTKPKHSIVTKNMKLHIIGQIIYQLVALLVLHYAGRYMCIHDQQANKICLCDPTPPSTSPSTISMTQVSYTIVFNAFVFCQIFNQFNCRRINNEWNLFKSIHKSLMFVGLFALTVSFQVLLVQVGLANLVPLTWYQWLVSVGVGLLCIPVGYLLRFLSSNIISSNKFKRGMNRIRNRVVGARH